MPSRLARLPPHYLDARRDLDLAFASLRSSDPTRYAERLAFARALAERAEHWRSHELRLPRGVRVVPMLDEHDHTVHAIEWGCTPPPAPPAFFHDPAMAIELSWTAFVLRRPWAIDDERLRALVEHPPVPHARILAELLSPRFYEWLRRSLGAMMQACLDDPPEQGVEALEELFQSYAAIKLGYEGRATLSVHELSGWLDVAEPDSSLSHEVCRWRWMLHDYTERLDPGLHARLEALADRFDSDQHEGVRKTWDRVLDCRQLDACLGLLLARAAMLDPRDRPSLAHGHVDPMATRAAGSLAWWCRWTLDAWDDEYPLGDRLRPEEIPTFVRFARLKLHELAPDLADDLARVFPLEG